MTSLLRTSFVAAVEPADAVAPGAVVAAALSVANAQGVSEVQLTRVVLAADAPATVPVPTGTNFVFIIVPPTAQPVRARVTTTQGAQQALPVAGVLVVQTGDDPLTALDLTREAGAETTVDVFLGVVA